ncbi:MAG: GNAT family N-acetyltransferase [Micavibrio aeruginosavorus]|uniref:GNAT family N-acetyltransferase n=1 Tax=Micavibrio aeruginosavorus TaxID=349221 RepID=A0A7T5UIW4_9BACT|nr:MAG: GNAT family N-acetyltransferase [Micavibrio aeruginosavorus]
MTDPRPQIDMAKNEDLQALKRLAPESEAAYFEKCLQEQEEGRRLIFLAWVEENPAGYVFLNRRPRYQPFRRLDIPEIQDLYVAPPYRRQGIGEALVKACERQVLKEGCAQIGIAVGLHAGFGAAQRLYVRLGYMPDGGGVTYDREPVRTGEMRPVDDDLTLMLVRDMTP